MEGIYIYNYGEINRIVDDIENTDFKDSYERIIPKYMMENNLKNILVQEKKI
jgi:hypothetical protein